MFPASSPNDVLARTSSPASSTGAIYAWPTFWFQGRMEHARTHPGLHRAARVTDSIPCYVPQAVVLMASSQWARMDSTTASMSRSISEFQNLMTLMPVVAIFADLMVS